VKPDRAFEARARSRVTARLFEVCGVRPEFAGLDDYHLEWRVPGGAGHVWLRYASGASRAPGLFVHFSRLPDRDALATGGALVLCAAAIGRGLGLGDDLDLVVPGHIVGGWLDVLSLRHHEVHMPVVYWDEGGQVSVGDLVRGLAETGFALPRDIALWYADAYLSVLA
jgi:hypothetical protein